MANFEEVALQFVQFYYNVFDNNRNELASLYRPSSMLTFEASQTVGAEAILGKLTGLPFGQIKHQFATVDAQPADENGAIVVLVTGALLVDAEERPMSYCQMFKLQPEGGSYFVQNDIFKLVYPAS